MSQGKDKGIVDRIWAFFASIRLAIVAFSLIALSSVVGTLIEQGASYEKNIEVVGKLVGRSAAPAVYKALEAMGFMDMYHSWWFTAFLMLFAANIVICSLDRFPPIWRIVKEPQKALEDERFKGFPIKMEFTVKGGPERVREALKALRFNLQEARLENYGKGDAQYYGQKGRYSRLGVFVTHLSIIVIMAGALIGITLGFKGFLNLPEGATYAMAFERVPLTSEQFRERGMLIDSFQEAGGDLGRTAMGLGVEVPRLRERMKMLGIELLDFSVTCEDFEVQFYGDSDMPKEFTSLLTVRDGGREVMRKWIEVNDPLIYKGYYFYQSSYALMKERENYHYKMRVASKGGQSQNIDVHEGESFTIPGTDVTATLEEFSPALSFNPSGRAFTYTWEMMNNPAVKLKISDGKSEYFKWILKRYPQSWPLSSGHSIELLDVWGSQYTGLQVRKDPGVWVVYLGCLLMSVGLCAVFFTSHRKIWVRVEAGKGKARVILAASANKNRESFRRKIDAVAAVLQEGGK
jgi:cytochrome c biogenesis protein